MRNCLSSRVIPVKWVVRLVTQFEFEVEADTPKEAREKAKEELMKDIDNDLKVIWKED